MSNKRLRLSPVCDNREEPSASLKDLPDDILKYCFSFIPGSYITVAPVSKHFYSNYSTLGIHESATFNSAETLLEIGRNKRTTADTVASDLPMTEYCFIVGAPDKFMEKVCTEAARKSRRDIIECCKTFGINCSKVFDYWSPVGKLAKEGDLDMIKYLVEKYHVIRNGGFVGMYHVFESALEKGHLDILQWLNEKFPTFMNSSEAEHRIGFENGHYMFEEVLKYGNPAAIKWFVNNVNFQIENEAISETLVRRGELKIFEVMEGLYEPVFNENIFQVAAESCNIAMLDYLYKNNCPFDADICSHVFEIEDNDKALLALKWLRRHNFPWDERTCKSAAVHGNFSALKFARDGGCPWDEKTLVYAARNDWDDNNDAKDMVIYCLQNGCPLSSEACQNAMNKSDDSKALELLKMLRKYSCPWDEETCKGAAYHKNFETLIWAKNNGCPWNPSTFLNVLSYGSITVIEYFLRSENQLVSLDGILETVFTSGKSTLYYHSDISEDSIIAKLKLLCSYGLVLTKQACALAARLGRLRVLQWLKYMECPWDAATCTGAVMACKFKFEILKYAHENGCELSKNTYTCCLEYGDVYGYLHNHKKSTKVKLLQYLEENNCPKPSEYDW